MSVPLPPRPSGHAPPLSAAVRQQASAWFVELQADAVSADTLRRWQAWRQAHADHERAWQHIEAFRQRLQGLPSPLAHAALAPPRIGSRRRAVKTLAVLVGAGGAAWAVEQQAPWRAWVADRSTAGTRAGATLPDGTRVTLNAGSAIDIRFTASERALRLHGGEILVATAHEEAGAPRRPFVVHTRQGRIEALGTRFSVRDLDHGPGGASRIAVFEGAVALRPDAGGPPLRLSAGEQGRLTRDGAMGTGRADEDDLAWTQGMIVAQDLPLADFLAELARYRRGSLRCDPAVAHLKVTGTYPTADTDRVLDMLAVTLPVEVRAVTRYWVTVRARDGGH